MKTKCFIGSNLVRLLLERGHEVLNIDALTYAGNVRSLDGTADSPAYQMCIRDSVNGHAALLEKLFLPILQDGQALFFRHALGGV